VRNDSALAEILSKDWIYVGPTRVLSKSEFVENIKHISYPRERLIPTQLRKRTCKVRVFGDTAVVTYIKEYRQNPILQNFSTKTTPMSLLVEAGGWRLRFTKVVPVQTQSAAN